MKSYKILLLLTLLILAGASCRKKKVVTAATPDYLIVGWTGGYVPADYKASYFRISSGELRIDTSQYSVSIPKDVSKFNFNYLQPVAKYDKVKDLPAAIPAELYSKNNATIGTYMVDAGYTDVRAQVNGVVYKWQFEAKQDSSSAEVRAFYKRLNTDFF